MAKAHLHVITPDTGELFQPCPACEPAYRHVTDQLAGSESNLRSLRGLMADLKREYGEAAEDDPNFQSALAVFRYWQERCKHPGAQWTAKRFELIAPLLAKYGADRCRAAIRGAAFDPYVTRRKNGSANVHNAFELIFRSPEKLEEFEARAPDVVPSLAHRHLVDLAQDVAARVAERASLIERDPVVAAHLLVEINHLLIDWLHSPYEGSSADPPLDQPPRGTEPADPAQHPQAASEDSADEARQA